MKHFIWALILLAGNAMAQTDTEQLVPAPADAPAAAQAAPAPPPPCETDEHHQFDFWIGEWDVTQNGQPAGHNIIKRVHNCALFENWISAAGTFTGSSLNVYNRNNSQWHQSWVDSAGSLLQMDGGLIDGNMVMSSASTAADGSTTHNRITWTPNEDGSVLQTWDTSPDGEAWTTVFNGLYVKVSKTE